MNMLKRIQVEGFKSIKKMDLELGPINVLIGANGAGKSNFLSLFEMLNAMIIGGLQLYIAQTGYANSILYYGLKNTSEIPIKMIFDEDRGQFEYVMKLVSTKKDTLIFEEEKASAPSNYMPLDRGKERQGKYVDIVKDDFKESGLNDSLHKGKMYSGVPGYFFRNCKPFHFNDTTESADVRNFTRFDYDQLYADAGNLAAYLYMLQESTPDYFKRIVSTITLAVPYFDGFVLDKDRINPDRIILRWKEKGHNYTFSSHQASDGFLRFIALVTLLLQPKEYLPQIIIIDEPELGLHPAAINLLGALIRKVSHYRQVIIATQSVNLVDNFTPEELVIVERKGGESIFKKTTTEEIKDWLEDYTLSELW
ncbi:MAG: AAA family ATPase, partial [Calditrichaeota bacterium]|nr:AAA family ATPase [Calditrichota bacterium]